MSTVKKLIEIALDEEGYLEKNSNESLDDKTANPGKKNFTKYARDLDKVKNFYNGRKQSFSWCDVFVDWCFVQTFGVKRAQELLCQPDKSTGAGVVFSKSFYAQKNQYHKSPEIGDQIFFKKNNKICHTGLVYKIDATYVYTIEGNTSSAKGVVSNGGCVRTKKYRLNASSIDGYGRPDYSEKELEEVEIATNRMIMYVDNVDYEGLNVRSLKNNEVVEILPIGSVIKVIKILDGRAYLGECKYVYSIYLSKKQPKLKTVTGADEEGLNVRKKRNTKKSNEPIACLKNGTKVKVYGIRFGWSKISPDSEAWVISKYLK